jgi:hypothetical protein
MFRNLIRIAGVAQRVAVRNPAMFFHATPALQDVKVADAKVPKAVKEHFLSTKGAGEVLLSRQELDKRSQEFWKLLLKEAESDAEAKNLVGAIKAFRRGDIDPEAPHILLLQNPLPKVAKAPRFLRDINISAATGEMKKEEMVQEVKDQSLNTDLLQIVFHLCGLRVPDRYRDGINSYMPFFVSNEEVTQKPHMDGGVKDSEVKVRANSLFAFQQNPNLRVVTTFIAAEDIVAELSEESLRILQEPHFVARFPDSREEAKTAHPILRFKDGFWTLLYPNGQVDAFNSEAMPTDDLSKIRGVIEDFKIAILQAKKEKSCSIELSCDSDGNPDKLLIFNNPRVAHLREVEVISALHYLVPSAIASLVFSERRALSLLAISDDTKERSV